MATYSKVVELIDGWQILTDAELIEAATSPHLEWFDDSWWTCFGIADCIGALSVKPLLERIRQTDFDWVADMASGTGCPFGDAKVNPLLLSSGDPDMIQIAQATRKLISLCESQGLANNGQAVVDAAKSMRLELLRSSKRAEGATRWNSYNRALDTWDGNPNTEPQL